MKSYALALTLAGLLAAGCGRQEEAPAVVADTGPRYPLTGEILDVDVERRILIVRHDEIPGYMPEMVMEFGVSAGDAANARPGQLIRAEMIPSDTGNYRLEKIWPDDRVAAAVVAAGTNALRQDTAIRGRRAYREVGENLPDFALYDQSGAVVQSARFRGKQIMLNFIFTRCPVATMCPAATQKMMETQRLAREAGVANLELVSITLDPVYDTPGVLKEYADARGIDTGNFSFLTGPEGAIKDLLAQFGVITEFQGPILNHTLATILINEQGRIIHRFDGSNWEPRDFVAKMRRP
ncbi:MAG: SCO family protein [Opitutaceae bacterium]|nr:SCO family protein [Opitutaceae bacterium]